jgi:hypothetical protein
MFQLNLCHRYNVAPSRAASEFSHSLQELCTPPTAVFEDQSIAVRIGNPAILAAITMHSAVTIDSEIVKISLAGVAIAVFLASYFHPFILAAPRA